MTVTPYFFDTNVLIGYCYCYDPQHKNAQKIFHKEKSTHHWSTNVECEFNEIYQEKQNKITDLITKLVGKLTNLLLKLKDDHKKEINEGNKKIKPSKNTKNLKFLLSQSYSIVIEDFDIKSRKKIIETIWKNARLGSKEPINKIILILEKFESIFYLLVGKNRKKMMKKLNDLHKREILYPECENILPLDGIDQLEGAGGDMSICLDAHDLVNKKPFLYLKLITDDTKFYNAKKIIEEKTNITEVICLRHC